MRVLASMTLDLQSHLLRWNLQRPDDKEGLTAEEVEREVEWNYQILMCWGGQGLVERVREEARAISASNLLAITRASERGTLNTYWGNDHAFGLRGAMRRGAVIATANPQLINLARKEQSEVWGRVKERLIEEHPLYGPEELGIAMTIEVILENAKEIRPIYAASGGRFGYVSVQVNPRNSRDSEGMLNEALSIYKLLAEKMDDVPNVVFKVPATAAGIPVVRELTARGIGVNVTVNFTLSQQLAFAAAIEQGSAKVSFLTEMSGRLDDLVAEELEALGMNDARAVSTWAGVAVTRRAYSMLYSGARAFSRSSLLVASLRGPWHIERSLSNGGVPLYITIFPDKALEYDREPRGMEAVIDEEIPDEILYKLKRSRIFMKAYEPDGLDPVEFDSYEPVVATLSAFRNSYDEFLRYLNE